MTSEIPEQVLRVYGHAVEMADRVSSRRGAANQFYLSLESVFLGLPAAFSYFSPTPAKPAAASALLLIAAVIAGVWWLQLRSYRDLNRAKYDVILSIERNHLILHPYADEWDSLKRDPVPGWRGRYAELGVVERVVPIVFAVADIAFAVIVWL